MTSLESNPFWIAVEAAPNAMIMINEHGKIVLVNRQAEALFGYKREEILNQPVEMLVPTRYRQKHPTERKKFWNHPSPRRMGVGRDLYGLTKNGTEVPVEIGLTPVEFSGGRYVISAIVNITERKQAEELLKTQSEQLARSNAELEQFAHIVSHDLQSPLRHISTYIDFIKERLGQQLDSQTQQWLNFIVKGSLRMQTLIGGLLAYSRVSQAKAEFSTVDTQQTVQEALGNLQTVIQSTHTNVSAESLPTLKAEPFRLIHLFQNLIENAIKFKKKTLDARIQISAKKQGSDWVFSIQDNGIGIDEQYQEKIFVIFQRLHSADEYPGTGVGLAICKKIVEFHKGKIWFKSKAGEGTTFFFSLPEEPQEN